MREIEGTVDALYRQHGMLNDGSDDRTLQSLGDIQAIASVARQGCHLLQQKLLELHPEFADEIRNLLASAQYRS